MELVYKHERPLFVISLIIGIVVWAAVTIGTLGIILIWALFGLLAYLFAHSGFISHLRGNAVELSDEQLPDLYQQHLECCQTLKIDPPPRAYVMMSDGVLNALATRFLRRHYVVLYSSILDALKSRPDAVRFYLGHELGHIKRGHLNLRWLIFPASLLPILGAAHRRAQEYTCDLHGRATSKSADDALTALTVLASGGERLKDVNISRLMAQRSESGGFWMSFHELTNDYPWLSKRLSHVAAADGADGGRDQDPRRSFWAWVLACFVPRFGFGAGGPISILIMVAIFGILAAIAIPAYQDYTLRAQVAQAMPIVDAVRAAAEPYVAEHEAFPESVEDLGVAEAYEEGPVSTVEVVDSGIAITLRSGSSKLDGQTIVVGAYRNDDGTIGWHCMGGTLEQKLRPLRCRRGAQ